MLEPVARTLDHVADATIATLRAHPRLSRTVNGVLGSARRHTQRRRNLAALASMRELDDDLLRDLGVNRIAIARARLAPRRCDPIAVLRRESGLDV